MSGDHDQRFAGVHAALARLSQSATRSWRALFRPRAEHPVKPADLARIARLHPALRQIVDAELRAGNTVDETWENYGFVALLSRPFLVKHRCDPDVIEHVAINDPHYWKEEYRARGTDQAVACRF